MKILSYLLIIFGILWCLIGGYYLWLTTSPTRLQFKNVPQSKEVRILSENERTSSQPVQVIIKDLQINLPIYPANVTNDIWETTYEGASYLTSSPLPGESGNSIMYGHNWTSLFGNLVKAKPGQTVEIVYADGSKKRFVINTTETVGPADSHILSESKDKRITLYTCTGFLDSKRFVVVAILENDLGFSHLPRTAMLDSSK